MKLNKRRKNHNNGTLHALECIQLHQLKSRNCKSIQIKLLKGLYDQVHTKTIPTVFSKIQNKVLLLQIH